MILLTSFIACQKEVSIHKLPQSAPSQTELSQLSLASARQEATLGSIKKNMPFLETIDHSSIHNDAVSIRYRMAHEKKTSCSGVLISPRLVLTAAHCVIGKNSQGFIVQTKIGNNLDQSFKVESFGIHPNYLYLNITHGYDIAYLKLKRPALRHDEIKEVLIEPQDIANLLEDRPSIYLIGYGRTQKERKLSQREKGGAARNKKKLNVTLYSVADRRILARGGEEWTTKGDSGAPYYVQIGGELKLLSIHKGKIIDKDQNDLYLNSSLILNSLCWLNSEFKNPVVTGDFCLEKQLLYYSCMSFHRDEAKSKCYQWASLINPPGIIKEKECYQVKNNVSKLQCIRSLLAINQS